MAWTTLNFSFGSILTSAKMTQLYDNLTALAAGDSGAPSVTTTAWETPANGNRVLAVVGTGERNYVSALAVDSSFSNVLSEWECKKTGVYKLGVVGDALVTLVGVVPRVPSLAVIVNSTMVGSYINLDSTSYTPPFVGIAMMVNSATVSGTIMSGFDSFASISINSGDVVKLCARTGFNTLYQATGIQFINARMAIASNKNYGLFNFDVRTPQNYPL